MTIRNIDFGPIWDASGVRGFYGNGYWFHHWLRLLGLSFGNERIGEVTFVAKTTTLLERPGNMPQAKDGVTPRDRFPACVVVKPLKGVALNAVGLSGPGAQVLLDSGRWQARTKPFFISFMPVGNTPEENNNEFRTFLEMLTKRVAGFSAPFGLQLNVTCPNTGHDLEQTVAGAIGLLDVLAEFNPLWPCLVKVSADTSPVIAARIAEHDRCDGLVISNAIKFGLLPDKIDWKGLFGSADATKSPLASMGGGGLSGAPLLPLVEAWVKAIRCLGMTKHINAGGGILHPRDVARLLDAGADSVFLGIIAMMRPWHMRGCIRTAFKKTWDPRPREKA